MTAKQSSNCYPKTKNLIYTALTLLWRPRKHERDMLDAGGMASYQVNKVTALSAGLEGAPGEGDEEV